MQESSQFTPADTDNDGRSDAMVADQDADGTIDTLVTTEPETGNGVALITNPDGTQVSVAYDPYGVMLGVQVTGPDGVTKTVTQEDLGSFMSDYSDQTGSPLPETLPYDGDQGVAQVPIDEDTLTTVEDVAESPAYQDWSDEQNPMQVAPDLTTEGAPVDSSTGIVGDISDADFWFQQNTNYTCGPASATQIIADFTGVQYPNEDAVANYAAQRGWLSDTGMAPQNLEMLLDEFGVPSTMVKNQTWDDIANYLQEGRSVVMFVDGFDYWPNADAQDQPENTAGDVVNHFARIVAIDTERGVAILADPGTPNGYQLEVPLATLEEAWNDVTSASQYGSIGERIAIVSDQADPTLANAAAAAPTAETPAVEDPIAPLRDLATQTVQFAAPTGSGEKTRSSPTVDRGLFGNPHGWVLIPVTLAAARIFSGKGK